MPLTPHYQLYIAAYNALTQGVTEPRGEVGQMCHHMVFDLLERAGLVSMERISALSRTFTSEELARRFLAREFMDVQLDGAQLVEAVNSQSVILCLYKPAPGQHPAHSLVSMGYDNVAGFNNTGSTGLAGGLNQNLHHFSKFPWHYINMDHVTVWGASPGAVAERIMS